MERWEYQVIHLNVEGPQAPPAAQPSHPPPAARPEPMFSKEFLEKEFPGFYGAAPASGAPAQDHPANQLRGFLNLQGRRGWRLLGFFPVGQLTMMIFRRPLVEAAAQQEPAAAAPLPAAAVPVPPSPPAPPAPASTAPQPSLPQARDDSVPTNNLLMQRILERLEALESRLAPGPQAPVAPLPGPAAPMSSDPDPADQAAPLDPTQLRDGLILPPERLRALAAMEPSFSAEAARLLGFRSASSLSNAAARSGYRPGLIKRGPNGRLAVYLGSDPDGSRVRHRWAVLPASD